MTLTSFLRKSTTVSTSLSLLLTATTTTTSFIKFTIPILLQQHRSYPKVSTVVRAMATTTNSTTTRSFQQQNQIKGAIIFLHGLGDGSPNGWEISLQQQLIQHIPHLSSSTNLVYIFPSAPILPISINGGTKMSGWFDLYDWPIDIHIQKEDRINIEQSITTIKNTIYKCMNEYNLSLQQIIIGGFSQGGAIALLLAYHPIYGISVNNKQNDNNNEQQHLGGCINLSGWIPFRNNPKEWENTSILQKQNIQNNIPLFWGHGQYDDIVLYQHQNIGINFLLQNNIVQPNNLQPKHYPVGHTSHPNEMKDVAIFIDQILFQNNNNNNNMISNNNDIQPTETDKEMNNNEL